VMIWLAAVCALGLSAGFLLLWQIPSLRDDGSHCDLPISMITPARNEERNLPALLQSLRHSTSQPAEMIVVDDASTDATAEVARSYGAAVLSSARLPSKWTGKTWACHQGANAANHKTLFFLDADTSFVVEGFNRIAGSFSRLGDKPVALSVLPYHTMEKSYEQLSLLFNLLMAMGAGGFGIVGSTRLFGQSLILSRDLYQKSGGHEAVASHILENLALAEKVKSVGGSCICIGGYNVLHMRMFPDGLRQLCEGWTKAFADGAAASGSTVLFVSIYWLTAMSATALLLAAEGLHSVFALVYLGFALQLFLFARRVGKYSPITCLFYPIPLLFYFGIFARSLFRRVFKRKVAWRGRSL
jgi:4,4'-diaponeurosporenoate glycosyltransferase